LPGRCRSESIKRHLIDPTLFSVEERAKG
jgi:hypothetical protein